jgi:aldehyde:ferredoxin oxidoreductase
MTKYSEEYMTLLNSFGLCIRPPVLRTIGPSLMSEAFYAVYGYEMDENELLFAAERIVNMAHIFNLDRGLTFQDYHYPDRFYKESEDYIKGERLPLDQKKIEGMLKAYFAIRGWDETGHVKEETIKRLGIG